MLTRFRTRWTEQRGAVVVIVGALLLPLTLLLAFAIETGLWWTHHGHLQTEADAAVFAGASGPWLPDCNDSPTDPNSIVGKALAYSGDQNRGALYNYQYSDPPSTKRVHALVNSADYWSPGGTNLDNTDPDGSPCTSLQAGSGFLDLKATEDSLPTFLGAIPGFRSVTVHTHARVEIQQLSSGSGMLPIGVPDPNPVAGAALFYNESCNSPGTESCLLAKAPLTKNPTNPVTLNGQSLVEWDSSSVNMAIRDPKTGVIIAFTGNLSSASDPSWLNGSLSEICSRPLVECYQLDEAGDYTGLSFIHGYTNAGGTPSAPNLGSVTAQDDGCGDDSAPYFILNGNCTVRVSADIDFGNATDIQVAVDGPGCPNGSPAGCPMTLDASGLYTTQDSVPTLPTGAGPVPFTINWKDKDPSVTRGSPNRSGSFSTAHRLYLANDDPASSGPVKYVKVVDPSTGDVKNSVHFNDSISFRVKVGVEGSLEVQSQVSDPIVKLRIVGGRTSNRHTLDCDPTPGIDALDPGYSNLWQELAYGCYPQYTTNTGAACPSTSSALWQPQPPPYDCVWVQTGGETNQVAKGLNQRIFGDTKPAGPCPAAGAIGHNNWKYDPDDDGTPDIPADDPRALFVFVVPFGSFAGSGSYAVPVTGLAAFYISGYTGQGGGFGNPCEGDPDEDPTPGPATIVGHFSHYVFTYPGTGTGSGCVVTDPTVTDPCIAVLTQ